MWHRIAAAFSLFFIPTIGMGQDDVITDFAPNHAEKFITDILKVKILNKAEDKKNNRIIFATPDGHFDVIYLTGKSKNLLFAFEYAMGTAELDKLNDWNRSSTFTKAVKSSEGKVVLTGSMNLDAGVSYKQLQSYYAEIQRERGEFQAMLFPKKTGLPSAERHFVALTLAQGGDEQIKSFTADHVEKFIKDGIKTKVEQRRIDAEKNEIAFLTPEGHFDIIFRDGAKKVLMFRFPYGKGRQATLEKINEFNFNSTLTRVVIQDGQLHLLAAVPLDAGVSLSQLKAFYDVIQTERQIFEERTPPKKGAQLDPKTPFETVRQGFPAARFVAKNPAPEDLEKCDTGWEVKWDFSPVDKMRVFRIVSAKFSWKDANGKPRSLVVVRNLQLVEAFTQYNDGSTCFLDIAKVGLAHVPGGDHLLGPACVGPGQTYETTIPVYNAAKKADIDRRVHVHKELHYDSLRWVSVYGGYDARKGEKLVLWNAIASGNYVYLMEYNFTDDGRIVCRLGFTAHNFFDRAAIAGSRYGFRKNDGDVHPHIGCWRLDFDLSDPARNLGGPEANELKLVRRVHEQGKFRQDERPFPGDDKAAKDKTAREGKAKWVAKHFTTLRAESQQVKNSRGAPIAYDLVTTRTGTAEDLMPIAQAFGAKMDFVNYDFWVTRTPNEFKHYYQVPDFATGQALAGQRTTVWHSVPALHVPRDEDFAADGMNAAKGVALTEWIGFTLRPRNLFDGTPLFKTPGQ